jgi:hypothetical protein
VRGIAVPKGGVKSRDGGQGFDRLILHARFLFA